MAVLHHLAGRLLHLQGKAFERCLSIQQVLEGFKECLQRATLGEKDFAFESHFLKNVVTSVFLPMTLTKSSFSLIQVTK